MDEIFGDYSTARKKRALSFNKALPMPRSARLRQQEYHPRADFVTSSQVYYKCYQRSYKAQALQNHLRYHRDYSEPEVERLAGSDAAMAASLPRAERILYRNLDQEVVGAGPQAFADTGETCGGFDTFQCRADVDCSMKFSDEASLLDHCR